MAAEHPQSPRGVGAQLAQRYLSAEALAAVKTELCTLCIGGIDTTHSGQYRQRSSVAHRGITARRRRCRDSLGNIHRQLEGVPSSLVVSELHRPGNLHALIHAQLANHIPIGVIAVDAKLRDLTLQRSRGIPIEPWRPRSWI
ncbi:hypothetical protein D3C77_481370 [compost metagenome]